jgi:flagellar assembly factor FliW
VTAPQERTMAEGTMAERTMTIVSKHLGRIDWDRRSELALPAGIPGFEDELRMVAVEVPAQRPLVFLQSLEKPEICFVSLPVRTIRPDYQLALNEEDRIALEIGDGACPEIGADVLCLALLFPSDGSLEANLGAPIVINLHNLRCVQSQGAECEPCHYRLSGEGRWERVC